MENLLLDDTREDVYIKSIDAHYEDIGFLNKLNVTHTLRCQKHVTNCALQNVNYSIGGLTIKNKHNNKHNNKHKNKQIIFYKNVFKVMVYKNK